MFKKKTNFKTCAVFVTKIISLMRSGMTLSFYIYNTYNINNDAVHNISFKLLIIRMLYERSSQYFPIFLFIMNHILVI